MIHKVSGPSAVILYSLSAFMEYILTNQNAQSELTVIECNLIDSESKSNQIKTMASLNLAISALCINTRLYHLNVRDVFKVM